MADFRLEGTIGARIRAARRARGMRTQEDLANAIPGDLVTLSTIQNLEAGRQTGLTVGQLLNIAFALKIAPAYLLAPVGRPGQKVDMPNLSDGIASMTIAEFEAWFSGASDGAFRPVDSNDSNERAQLEAMRELERQLRERRRLRVLTDLHTPPTQLGAADRERSAWDTTAERLDSAERLIEILTARLRAAGWDLDGWAD